MRFTRQFYKRAEWRKGVWLSTGKSSLFGGLGNVQNFAFWKFFMSSEVEITDILKLWKNCSWEVDRAPLAVLVAAPEPLILAPRRLGFERFPRIQRVFRSPFLNGNINQENHYFSHLFQTREFWPVSICFFVYKGDRNWAISQITLFKLRRTAPNIWQFRILFRFSWLLAYSFTPNC